MIDSAELTESRFGVELVDKTRNRWSRRGRGVAIDLPRGWRPVLDPRQSETFFAVGPLRGYYPKNYLKIDREYPKRDLEDRAREIPHEIQRMQGTKLIKCAFVGAGETKALETVYSEPSGLIIVERLCNIGEQS